MLVYIVTLLVLAVSVYFLTQKKQQKPQKSTEEAQESKEKKPKKEKSVSLKQLQKSVKSHKQEKKKIQHKNIEHPLYLNSAMNFSDDITDFCVSGQFIAVSSMNKSFKLFDILTVKDEVFKFHLYQFQFDYPTAISVSEDNEYVVVAMKETKEVQIYQVDVKQQDNKKKIKLVRSFGANQHSEEITKIYISDGNKFVITFADNTDTNIKIWDFRSGELLKNQQSGLGQNYFCSFSQNLMFPCGRVPDLKVYRFVTDKNSLSYNKLEKILDLPHPTSIVHSNVSQNEERAFTISKDNDMKVWKINVDFHIQEDAKLLKEFTQKDFEAIFPGQEGSKFRAMDGAFELSTKKWVYAVGSDNEVALLDKDFKEIGRISDILAEGCVIDEIKIHKIKTAYVLLVSSKKERRISLYKINSLLK